MDGQAVSSDAPDTSKLIVEFYEDAILDDKATNGWIEEQFDYQTQKATVIRHQGAGRQVWKPADFIEIRIPMNLKEIRRRQVRESDKQKWPREWAAYQQTKTNPGFGTPLESLPFLTKAQVNEFKALGLKTAENVRDISDSDGQKYMGFQQLRRRVTDFLAAAEGNAPLATLRSEVTAKEAENTALKVQIQELIARSEKAKK
jgi:hypothetical protein